MKLNDKHICIIAAVNALLLLLFCDTPELTDTQSYIDAWDNSLAHGRLDMGRTPAYPLFLGICKLIAGVHFAPLVTSLQYAVFILSARYFRKAASLLIASSKTVWWLTLAYVVAPGIAAWASAILTESLATSGIVFLFYCLLNALKSSKMRYALWSTLWLMFLIMLRPAFIYLFPVCAAAWVLAARQSVKTAACGMLGIAVVALLYCGYCIKFKEAYGVLAISSVSTSNQAHVAFQHCLMRAEFTDSPEYRAFIMQHQDRPTNLWDLPESPIVKRFGLATVQQSVDASYRAYPVEWVKTVGARLKQSAKSPMPESYTRGIVNAIAATLQLPMTTLYLWLIAYLAMIARQARRKSICRASLLLWLAVAGNVATAVIGAQAEWGRLVVPSMPLLLLMLGQAANHIGLKPTPHAKDILL